MDRQTTPCSSSVTIDMAQPDFIILHALVLLGGFFRAWLGSVCLLNCDPNPPPPVPPASSGKQRLCPAFTTTEFAVLHPFFPFLLWIYHALLFGLTAYISKPFFQTKRANAMAEASLSVVSHSIRIAAISGDDPFRTPRVSQRPSIEIPPFQRRPRRQLLLGGRDRRAGGLASALHDNWYRRPAKGPSPFPTRRVLSFRGLLCLQSPKVYSAVGRDCDKLYAVMKSDRKAQAINRLLERQLAPTPRGQGLMAPSTCPLRQAPTHGSGGNECKPKRERRETHPGHGRAHYDSTRRIYPQLLRSLA